jgi:hypothetical protein
VGATSLADAIWGGDSPRDEQHALQALVSRLRRALGDAEMVVGWLPSVTGTVTVTNAAGDITRLGVRGSAGTPAAAR